MEKKRVITSYEKLTPDVLELVDNKYPDGFYNHIIKIDKPNGDCFFAFTVDSATTSYLVKVNVTVDGSIEDLDEMIFSKKGKEYEGEEESPEPEFNNEDSDYSD